MSQKIKLTGVASFSQPSFKTAANGDLVHIKKGDVVRVTDAVAERLLDRVQHISEEDVRHTFSETNEKVKYDFAPDEAAAVEEDMEEAAGSAGSGEVKAKTVTKTATQRRGRTS